MNLSFYIAKRYLFSKKSHNAINVISLIAVCGIAIATMALVCTLSVFNGFTNIISMSFNAIDPDLQITTAKGKVFEISDPLIEKVVSQSEVLSISETLEENALARYGDRQVAVLIKGVSENFSKQTGIQKLLLDGDFYLKQGDIDYAVVGAGLAVTLGMNVNFVGPIELYAPKRDVKINLANPSTAFTQTIAYPSGVFALNQAKYDEQMVIISIEQARDLFRYSTEASSLDLKLKEGVNINKFQDKIKSILGDEFIVKNRFEQQEDSYRMVNIEKWVTFLILAFILIIAIFNVVGSLSMLILDKKDDMLILQNLGANNNLITKIFMLEGWMITIMGAFIGLSLGISLCLLQEYFGILKLGETPGAFIVDAYPVSVEVTDIVYIFVTVSIISFFAVLYPVNNLRRQLKKQQISN